MPNSPPFELSIPASVQIRFRRGDLSALMARDSLIIISAFLISSCGFLFGEKIQVQGGLGWDGVHYCTLAKHFDEIGRTIPIDAYRLQRVAPPAAVHFALRGLGLELSNANIIRAFGVLNVICITVLAWCWCRIVRSLEISTSGKWLGVAGLFLNYAVAKYAAYYPVLTDVSAMTIGAAMLCCYLESRQRTLLALAVLGAFTWPTLLIQGALLAMFPRQTQIRETPTATPWKLNVVIATLAAYYYVVLLISISHRVSGPIWNGVVPIRSVLGLSISIAAVYVFFVALRLLDQGELFDVRGLFRTVTGTNGIMVLSVVIATKCAQAAMTNLPSSLNPQTYVLLIGTWSIAKPGVFLLAHTIYYGPLVILTLLNWKSVSRTIHQYGIGVTLACLFGLANAMDSEARHVINFVPMFFPFVVKATDSLSWGWRQYATLAGLNLVFSKCWFQINAAPWVGNQFLWPDQRFAMSVGPYMNNESYLIQGAIFLTSVSLIYWYCVQSRTANARLVFNEPESRMAA